MTPTMQLLYFLLLMDIASMVVYLILIVLYFEQFAVPEGGLDAQTLLAATGIRLDSVFIGLKKKKIRKKIPPLVPK